MSIIDAVIAHQTGFFKPKRVDEKGYLTSLRPEDNLIERFPNWDKIEEELNEGAGGELKGKGQEPPHFLAVYSSSALCVNNFAPFKKHHTKLSFLDYTGFDEARFEQKLRTGLGGTPPHLDFYLASPEVVIGIESKFTEYFGEQAPNHPTGSPTKGRKNNLEPYLNREKLHYLPKGFQESIVEHYFADNKPQHLDVAQLIKHAVGLLHNCGKKKVILVYLYWEPLDPTVDSLFAKHRSEIEKFKHRIGRFIEFVPLSYPELWKRYENDALLKEHIGKVRERYGFPIKS